jgi:DNA primase
VLTKRRKPLSRGRSKLYFALDPDEAGAEAAYRLAKEYKGYILKTDYDKDYDEVSADIGVADFRKVIETAMEECSFYLDKVIENEPIDEALKEIAKLDMESEKDIWVSKLANRHQTRPCYSQLITG